MSNESKFSVCYEDATLAIAVDANDQCNFGVLAAVYDLTLIRDASSLGEIGIVKSGKCQGSCRAHRCPRKDVHDLRDAME